MIKIAVCDDVTDITQGVKAIIDAYKFRVDVSVDAFTDGKKLFDSAVKKRYDIIFIDIELRPENIDWGTGMSVSNKIKAVYPNVLIIFFSGKFGYEKELLNFEPFRYIQKPFAEKRIVDAVGAAIDRIMGWEEKFFRYQLNGIYFRKRLDKIIFFCSTYPYIEVHNLDGDVPRFRGKIDSIEKELTTISNDFLRPGKSFLVNRRHIASYSSKEIIMSNEEKIPISRGYRKFFLENIEK